MDAATLRRLAVLLDRAFDLDDGEREAWLASLAGDDADLRPRLRELLARRDAPETRDVLARGPAFSIGDAAAGAAGQASGDTIGPYRLLRQLGRGGMGEVWLAERVDGALKRKVALKLPHVTWAPGLAERFARERDILAALEHPNIARLYDAGVDVRGRPFMALEYVEGEPLDQYCRARTLPVSARVRLLLQVADAVAFAHGRLVLHRDLKPGNLLVTADGHVRLLDFGIAKLMAGDVARETALTQAAGRALTLDYASPEQIRGEPLGTASDVYSLGVVAFEVLAGGRPYRLKRGSAAELEEAITGADAPLASSVATDPAARKQLRGDLDAILNKALKKSPAERYATVDALAQDWRRHLSGVAVNARPDTWAYRATRLVQRHRTPLAGGAVVVAAFVLAIGFGATAVVILALLVGLGVALWQAAVARRQSAEARAQATLARKEAQRAQAVQRFMLDLFRTNTHQQADPLRAQQTTARELLDIGAERVSVALADAPESEIQVLNTLSDMYVQLGLRDKAIALQRTSVGVARRAHGPADPGRANAILAYVATLQERTERDEIPVLLAEARATLDAAGEATTFVRGALLMETARYHKHESLQAARDTADAAVAFLRRHHPQRPSLVTCHRLVGLARMVARDFVAAEAAFRSAVDTARLHGEAAPAWLVGSLADLGDAQGARLAFAEAEASLREALAMCVQVNGDVHRETLLTQVRLANLLLVTGRSDEGRALQAAVVATIDATPGHYDESWRLTAAGFLDLHALARGRPQDAAARIAGDLGRIRATFPRSNLRCTDELALAACWVAMGHLEDARSMLELAQATRRSVLGDVADLRAWLPFLRVQAELEVAEGRPAVALATLAAVPADALQWADAEPIAAEVVRAQALRLAGRGVEAAAAARRALDTLRALPPAHPLPHLEAAAWRAAGEAAAVQGDGDGARAALARACSLRRAHDAEGSLWLVQAERALAALATGPDAAVVGPRPAAT